MIVYISGPITKGDRNVNYFQACHAHAELMRAGFAVINPILSMLLPFAWQDDFPHSMWIKADFPLVRASGAVLRLPGESNGADEECAEAALHGIPVFENISELLRFRDDSEGKAA